MIWDKSSNLVYCYNSLGCYEWNLYNLKDRLNNGQQKENQSAQID